MAYDSIKARKAIQTAKVYERLPGSEFVLQMASVLKDADDEIAGSTEKLRGAEREARRYQREADELREDYRLLRESTGRPFELAKATLEQIAKGGKGAKKIAVEALAQLAPQEATSAPENSARPPDVAFYQSPDHVGGVDEGETTRKP